MDKWLHETFSALYKDITQGYDEEDFIGISCTNSNFSSGVIRSSFRYICDSNPTQISDMIFSAIQSNAEFDIDVEPLIISCAVVSGVNGSNRTKHSFDNARKKSILTINNSDNLCLPRSLVTAKADALRGRIRQRVLHDFWVEIRSKVRTQKEKAAELTRLANVTIPRNGCGLQEIAKFPTFLAATGFAIVVYNSEDFSTACTSLLDGPQETRDRFGCILHKLYILYYEYIPSRQISHHFEPILNIRDFCFHCNTGYNNTPSSHISG